MSRQHRIEFVDLILTKQTKVDEHRERWSQISRSIRSPCIYSTRELTEGESIYNRIATLFLVRSRCSLTKLFSSSSNQIFYSFYSLSHQYISFNVARFYFFYFVQFFEHLFQVPSLKCPHIRIVIKVSMIAIPCNTFNYVTLSSSTPFLSPSSSWLKIFSACFR